MSFQEEYRKRFRGAEPSAALSAETLALMEEAQDHAPLAAAPRKRWSPARVAALASAAAVLLLTVTVGAFMLRDRRAPSEQRGDFGQVVTFGNKTASSASDAAPEPETEPETVQENNAQTADNRAPVAEQPQATAGASVDQAPEEEIKDPLAPKIVNTTLTRTYLSLADFIDALEQKSAYGYGSAYYNTRALVIAPVALPEYARFRCLYLDSKTGRYAYSYLIPNGGNDFLLNIDVRQQVPATLKELEEQLAAVQTEDVQTNSSGNTQTWMFGADQVTVTLLPAAGGDPPGEAETAACLKQFKLARCALGNKLLDMHY